MDLSQYPLRWQSSKWEYGSLISPFFIFVLFGYVFFGNDLFQELGAFSFWDWFLLAGVFLLIGWNFLEIVILRHYRVTLDSEAVTFSKKWFFKPLDQWQVPLRQYEGLSLKVWPGNKWKPSLFSVDLVHPDIEKTIPIAASRKEVSIRGQLEELQRYLDLPTQDHIANRPEGNVVGESTYFQALKTSMCLLLIPVLLVISGWIFWWTGGVGGFPLERISCSVVGHEMMDFDAPKESTAQPSLRTVYRYTYQNLSYEIPSQKQKFSSQEKLDRYLSSKPPGAPMSCFIDARVPTRLMIVQSSQSFSTKTVLLTGSVLILVLGVAICMWFFLFTLKA